MIRPGETSLPGTRVVYPSVVSVHHTSPSKSAGTTTPNVPRSRGPPKPEYRTTGNDVGWPPSNSTGNGDGQVEGQVTDAVFLLNYNFLAGERPPCLAACDANGDGKAEGQVTDAVYLLTFNFLAGIPPVAPFPDCGVGPLDTDETLGCATPPEGCRQ